MTDKEERGWTDEERIERAIVLQVLRDDHDERWARAELELEISDFPPLAVNEALARLDAEGVVSSMASRCGRRRVRAASTRSAWCRSDAWLGGRAQQHGAARDPPRTARRRTGRRCQLR
jgi:hypothetical protein